MPERFNPTERIGVNKVEAIFLNEFRWIPRTLLQTDVGIDMHVEIVNENPTGKFISIQIKTGVSFFSEINSNSVIYRGTNEHLNYWLNYEMPVLIVVHNPETDITLWQYIKEENIERTSTAWKIEIPKTNILHSDFKTDLEQLNQYPEHLQKLQRFEIDIELINKIKNGFELILTIDQMINKVDGRLKMKIFEITNTEEVLLSETKIVSYMDIQNLDKLFPWADFEVDEDHYEFYDNQNLYSEYGIWDSEQKSYIGLREDHKNVVYEKIRPYDNIQGEMDLYRLRIKLSILGEAYLKLREFLEYGTQIRPLLNS